METEIVRQGDIVLVRSYQQPADLVQVNAPVVVGLGEVTGHRHEVINASWLVAPAVTADDLAEYSAGKIIDMVFVVAGEDSSLQHLTASNTPTHEHDAIRLEPGIWQVVRQSEYAPEAILRVAD